MFKPLVSIDDKKRGRVCARERPRAACTIPGDDTRSWSDEYKVAPEAIGARSAGVIYE